MRKKEGLKKKTTKNKIPQVVQIRIKTQKLLQIIQLLWSEKFKLFVLFLVLLVNTVYLGMIMRVE